MDERLDRVATPLPAADPEVGAALWRLEDARARLLAAVEGIDQAALDRVPPVVGNTVGALLYHVALIEADYLYADVLALDEEDFPEEMVALLPWPDRDGEGRLTVPAPMPLGDHLGRLATVRARLIETFSAMDGDDYRSPRALADWDITPEWVLHHLAQHEAEHRGQIQVIREFAEAAGDDAGG